MQTSATKLNLALLVLCAIAALLVGMRSFSSRSIRQGPTHSELAEREPQARREVVTETGRFINGEDFIDDKPLKQAKSP